MTQTTLQPTESYELTRAFRQAASVGAAARVFTTACTPVLKLLVPPGTESPIPSGYETLDNVVASLERNPSFKQEMKRARTWIAESVLANKPVTLRTLRLRQGMSQVQLAEQIGTQQPYIARIENGSTDLRLETCRKLAAALGVDLNTLSQALSAKETARS